MAGNIIKYTILYILLVLLQVIVFNNVCLFDIAIPYVFILFIMRLPIDLSLNWLFLLSFLLGFTIDIFSDTLGMNAMACTILAAVRRPVLYMYVQRDDDRDQLIPSIKKCGTVTFVKYALSLSLCYCILINLIQSFTFYNLPFLLLRTIGSTIVTFLMIWAIESLISCEGEKRL